MKKKLSLLLISVLFFSCKSYKAEYKFTNAYLNNKIDSILNHPLLEKETFYLIKDPIDKEHVFYRASFKELDSVKKLIPLNKVVWAHSKNEVNSSDIKEIIQEISRFKQGSFKWDSKQINVKKEIISLNQDSIRFYQKNTVDTKNKATKIMFMSKPFFNKKRNICLFLIATSSTYTFDRYYEKTLILKEENGKWTVVGEVYGSESD